MRKQILADNGAVMSSDYHRTVIDADVDPVVQMAAVNAHLQTMGYPAVKSEDHAVLNSAVSAFAPQRAVKAAEIAAKAAVK